MIGAWVRAERERRAWSQSELARRAGLTQPAINKLEAGTQRSVQAKTMAGLARAFGLTEAALYRAVYGDLPEPATTRLDALQLEDIPYYVLAQLGEVAQELAEQDWDKLVAQARFMAHERRQQHAADQAAPRGRRKRPPDESLHTETHQAGPGAGRDQAYYVPERVPRTNTGKTSYLV